MLRWPRPLKALAGIALPDADFHRLRGRNLSETLMSYARQPQADAVATEDLDWLQTEFKQFNVENRYPLVREPLQIWGDLVPTRVASSQENRRVDPLHRRPIGWLLRWLGLSRNTVRQPIRKSA
jgi:hypothetical protein